MITLLSSADASAIAPCGPCIRLPSFPQPFAEAGTRPCLALLSRRLACLRMPTPRRAIVTLSDLQYLIHQLGPATPEITTIIQEAIDNWMVEFDEGVSMQITRDERSGHVLMTCAIGQPDDGARESVYAALLGANLLLTGVADVKLALGDADDDVRLIGEYDLREATVDGLRNCLFDFLGYAGKFSQMIAATFEDKVSDPGRSTTFIHHDQV